MQLIARRIQRSRTNRDEVIITGSTPGARAKFRIVRSKTQETYETIWVCEEDLARPNGPRVGDIHQRDFDPIGFNHGPWKKIA